ncbi:unnamed protein product [Owenia fusiformis]|uniref:Uncharacterized protein n=1 Tax=Owenia fusiformis TaxID=6347 RepID=A0A8J1XIP5_OWEFU|nr:unnamed protein product [Owenia fusiformis]
MYQQNCVTLAVVTFVLMTGLIQGQKCRRQDIRSLGNDMTSKISTLGSEVKDKIEILTTKLEDETGGISDKISILESLMEDANGDDKSAFGSIIDQLAQLESTLSALVANKDCIQAQDGPSKILTKTGKSVEANCENGWLVIAHRFNGKVLFDRTWIEYKNGFGSRLSEYFVGFEAILSALKRGEYMIRFDLVGWKNEHGHAEYATFSVSDENDGYKLNVTGYNFTGTSNIDDYLSGLNGRPFSTLDNRKEDEQCPIYRRGPWWHGARGCGDSNLFSVYANDPKCDENYSCMFWYGFPRDITKFPPYPLDYSLKEMKMKIRPAYNV